MKIFSHKWKKLRLLNNLFCTNVISKARNNMFKTANLSWTSYKPTCFTLNIPLLSRFSIYTNAVKDDETPNFWEILQHWYKSNYIHETGFSTCVSSPLKCHFIVLYMFRENMNIYGQASKTCQPPFCPYGALQLRPSGWLTAHKACGFFFNFLDARCIKILLKCKYFCFCFVYVNPSKKKSSLSWHGKHFGIKCSYGHWHYKGNIAIHYSGDRECRQQAQSEVNSKIKLNCRWQSGMPWDA